MNDEDSVPVVGRVPKFDNDGKPVSNANLGSGGTRRNDGTLSSMAFDLKLADDGEPSRSDTAAIVAAFVVGGAAAFVAPHLKRLWVESLAPAATRGVSQIRWRLRGCSDSLSS